MDLKALCKDSKKSATFEFNLLCYTNFDNENLSICTGNIQSAR